MKSILAADSIMKRSALVMLLSGDIRSVSLHGQCVHMLTSVSWYSSSRESLCQLVQESMT